MSCIVTATAKATVDDLTTHDAIPVDQRSNNADACGLSPCDVADPPPEAALMAILTSLVT
jgi:hypothetical protein